jgi:1-deoxy-D-xylulose-5-phosphate synthase
VGIAEEHAVTFSGGMAKEGKIPFCNIYSSFMQRAIDEVIHDVALLNLHVVFCLDRAGLVGADGPTHHGAFDLPIFRAIPGMTICSPIDEYALRKLMYTAYRNDGPWMIRYPRGRGSRVDWRCSLEELPVDKGVCLSDGKRADAPAAPVSKAVLSLGPIGEEVKKAIRLAEAQQKEPEGYAHYDMVFLKPLDRELLKDVFEKYETIVTVEDGTLNGGLGSAVLEEASAQDYKGKVLRVGIPDEFIEQGTVSELWKLCGMDAQSIANILTA